MEPVARGAEPAGPVDARRAVLENHAALERLDHGRPEGALDQDVIDAADAVAGMGEAERERAVVGQEEEPLGVEVEPPTECRRAPMSGERGRTRGPARGDPPAW